MRTIVRDTPPPDESEHVITWTEGNDEREQGVTGEAAAVELWNALHAATVDPERRVNRMSWVELVQVKDGDGADVAIERVPRAHFSHGFAELGLYWSAGANAPEA